MRYAKPATAAEAAALLAGAPGKARVLAGGTDLLVQMKSGMVEPELIVDIKAIAETQEIAAEAGGFRVGAAVPVMAMAAHDGVSAAWPGVVEAAMLIGSTQVKGRATVAGNLCNASPAADSVPAMVAAGAVARIAGPSGTRELPVAELPAGPGRTQLAPGEFVTSILLPAQPARASDAYLRFTPRTEMDIAVASAAVSLSLDAGGRVATATVALGAVASTVRLVPAAAAAIVGATLDEPALAALAAACEAACAPIDDKRGTAEYRIHVAGVLARRAALIAKGRAEAKGGRA